MTGGAAALAGVAVVAACGGSETASGPATSSSGSNAAITVMTANVPGVGTVLVNGDGRTLYMLTSEQGGKITCTDDNGCTKTWPDTELPSGVTHGVVGNGAQASQLSTVKSADGHLYLTYGGWPLYTYSGDTGSMQAHGEGITSFGGTWYVLNASGTPVKTPSTSTSNGY
jgi:predicted lipoprotein with Yx(FWY)xxD motif